MRWRASMLLYARARIFLRPYRRSVKKNGNRNVQCCTSHLASTGQLATLLSSTIQGYFQDLMLSNVSTAPCWKTRGEESLCNSQTQYHSPLTSIPIVLLFTLEETPSLSKHEEEPLSWKFPKQLVLDSSDINSPDICYKLTSFVLYSVTKSQYQTHFVKAGSVYPAT